MDQNDTPVTPPEVDPSSFTRPAEGLPNVEIPGTEPSLLFALVGGSIVALALAILWALISVATEHQYGIVAIVIGLVTGSAVRYFGRGETTTFGVAGAFLSLASCLAGNILSVYGFIAKNNSWSIFQALSQVDFSRVLSAFPKTFSPMDFVFYGLAVYEGYRFSVVPTGPGPRAEAALFSSLMKPSLARFRKPLLIVAGVSVLAGITSLRYLASGQMTFTYESGAKQATGQLRSGKSHGPWTYFSEKGAVQSKLTFREGELDGRAQWWSEDGKLAREGAFWQGLEQGEWKNYDGNGTVASRGRFAYGRPVGEWEYRHPNNEKSLVCRYKLGALDGDYVSWHPNRTMSEQGRYQDGQRIGVWKTWDSGGLPLCEYRYEGEKEFIVNCWAADHSQTVRDGNGEFVSYHPNGQVNEKGEVTGGRRTGVWYVYHPNGTLEVKVRWDGETRLIMDAWNDKGEPLVQSGNGTYVSTSETGKTLVKGSYKNGLQDGEWTNHYPDTGAVMQVMNYAAGRLEGPSTGYFQSGAKEWDGAFKDNERDGEWIWYHESGEISSRVRLVAGKKDGAQIFFNSQGTKVREETYKAGALVAERDLI